MLLAVDVGNTQTVIGLYDGDRLVYMWRVATDKKHTSDEIRIRLYPLLAVEGIAAEDVHATVLASGVPRLIEAWEGAVSCLFGHDPFVVNALSAGSSFKTVYANPLEIGADRVADAIAAKTLYGAPAIVIDFGTATNIEVIDENGVFAGGVIAPGLETSATALFKNAARLSMVELTDPHTAIGTNTEQAVQAGIIYGEAERADGLVRRMLRQLDYDGPVPVIATGGLASSVIKASSTITAVNPELTLEGLRIIFEEQTK